MTGMGRVHKRDPRIGVDGASTNHVSAEGGSGPLKKAQRKPEGRSADVLVQASQRVRYDSFSKLVVYSFVRGYGVVAVQVIDTVDVVRG